MLLPGEEVGDGLLDVEAVLEGLEVEALVGVGVGFEELEADPIVNVAFTALLLIATGVLTVEIWLGSNNVDPLKSSCEVPKETTWKFNVARTPFPLAPAATSKRSDVSGMMPLLMAKVDDEVHINVVCPICCKNGPSVTFTRLKTAGLKEIPGKSHAQRFWTPLIVMLT